jgi:thiaminase/transcriptional activator TenA
MSFTATLWQQIEPVYQAILDHPFNRELADGSLSRERFKFYVQQDALYLADFGRALAILASRSTCPARMLELLRFAEGAVAVERALHEEYFRHFGITDPTGDQSPACFAYTNFMIATAANKGYEEGLAALLPCFWIYKEVGTHIHRTAAAGNPYQRWIDTYAGEEYGRVVDRAIEMTDEAAEMTSAAGRAAMERAFVASSRLEWMFWDSAYRLESWRP